MNTTAADNSFDFSLFNLLFRQDNWIKNQVIGRSEMLGWFLRQPFWFCRVADHQVVLHLQLVESWIMCGFY